MKDENWAWEGTQNGKQSIRLILLATLRTIWNERNRKALIDLRIHGSIS